MRQTVAKRLEPMWDDNAEKKEITSLSDIEDSDDILLLSDLDQIKEISLEHANEVKQYLAETRKRVRAILDGRKLAQAMVVIGAMENIAAIFFDQEVMTRVTANTSTAMDLKFLAEAYDKLFKNLGNLTRMDTLDGQGTPARVALGVKFGEGSGSTVVQAVVEVGSGRE